MPRNWRYFLFFALISALGLPQGGFANTAEQELKRRHQALLAAYNKRDLKALRTFYAPSYRYEEATGHKIPLPKYLSGLELMFKSLPKPGKDTATLSRIIIKKNSATALEKRMVQGLSGKVSGPAYTAQTWKKIGGLWKLAGEKEADD